MGLRSLTAEHDDLGGGKTRATLHVAPIAHRNDAGYLVRNVLDWIDSGDSPRPHVVSAANLMCFVAPDGLMRVHPTRDPLVYAEVGSPYINPAGSWVKVPFSNALRTRTSITWARAEVDQRVTHAGHFVKPEWELKGGYVPPNNQLALPIGMAGLTRDGGRFLADGVEVMHIRAPYCYDAANPADVRPVDWRFVQVGGQWYCLLTLPDLTGMARPTVDPTLTSPQDNTIACTFVRSDAPDGASGSQDWFSARNNYGGSSRNGLMKLDFSSIPGGSTCVDPCTMYLVAYTNTGGWPGTYAVYQILVANDGWTEAGATWNHKDGASDWAGGHGSACGTADTDYNSIQDGSVDAAGAKVLGDAMNITLTASRITAMLAANYGWVFIATNGAFGSWCSDDHATAGYRPYAVINYTEAGGLLIPVAMAHYHRMREAS